jgi:hypothetical protein
MTKPSARSVVLTLRISEDEQQQLRQRAGNSQQSVSEFVRGVVQDRLAPPPPKALVRSSSDGSDAGWTSQQSSLQLNQQTLMVRAKSR